MRRFETMAVPSLDVPRAMAVAHGRPVVTLRARRGGRRRYQEALSGFGERGVQILDTDGYALFVVSAPDELTRILAALRNVPDGVEVNAWDDRGERVIIEKGVQ